MINIRVSPEIFVSFPTLRRGILAAMGSGLMDAVTEKSTLGVGEEKESKSELAHDWREVFASLDYDVKPYLEMLVRRASGVDRVGAVPAWAWRLLLNVVREFGQPVSAFALNTLHPQFELVRAQGGEPFLGEATGEQERVCPGELISQNPVRRLVLSRNWNLRLATTSESEYVRGLLFIVDVIGSNSELTVSTALEAVREGVRRRELETVMGTLDSQANDCYLSGFQKEQTDPARLTLSLRRDG